MIYYRVFHFFFSSSATFCILKNGRSGLIIVLGGRLLPASPYLTDCEKAGRAKLSSPGKINAAAYGQTDP